MIITSIVAKLTHQDTPDYIIQISREQLRELIKTINNDGDYLSPNNIESELEKLLKMENINERS